jgi:hypothetical protein
MDHYGHSSDARCFSNAKKILETRFDPRRLTGLIVDLHLAASGQPQTFRSELLEVSRPQSR